jgi:hypothetical protein
MGVSPELGADFVTQLLPDFFFAWSEYLPQQTHFDSPP